MQILRLAILAACGLGVTSLAHATNGTTTFTGAVVSTCTILVSGAGVLDVSDGGRGLTSTQGLGTPALAVVTTTGANYRFSVSTPTSFLSAPAGGNSTATFATKYSLTGVTAAIDLLGNSPPQVLNLGITNVKVDLTASSATNFPSGLYTAQSVLTCE